MNGRLRSDWIRCARRMGSNERVKLAEEKRASVGSGGRPWLPSRSDGPRAVGVGVRTYRTRSARVKGCNGCAASRATWSSWMLPN